MLTNDERREVAEILRSGVGTTDYMSDEAFIKWLFRVVGRSCDGHILDSLAYLIEPEERTCRKVPGRMKYGVRRPMCSECGYSLGDERWLFCPKCGAKVVCDA